LEKIEMKKTLVAVAAMAAVTGAMADVSITGVFDAAISTVGGTRTVTGGTNGGSEVTFSVSDDLGGGLKASATSTLVYDGSEPASTYAGVSPSAGRSAAAVTSNLAQYQSWIAIGSDIGTAKIGQFWSETFLASTVGDVLGRAATSNYLAGGAQGQIANAVAFSTANYSGFSGTYQKSMDATLSAQQYNSYSINYNNGGLNVAYARGSLASNTKESILGANYNFGVATAYVGLSQTTAASTATTSSTGYGIAVPFGATVVSLGLGTGPSALKNYQVQAKYNFSKKTNAYVQYVNGSTTKTLTGTIVGVRHNF